MSRLKKFQYITYIKNDDYIVRDHRVHNVRIMPGVTYLEIIYRILNNEGYDVRQVELRNILFKEAISTEENMDREIRISLEDKSDYGFILVESRKNYKDQVMESIWEENCQCELHLSQESITCSIDLKSLKDQALNRIPLDDVYAFARNIGINHYDFMKPEGSIYCGEDYVLSETILSQLAAENLDDFYLHPAQLDSSTLVPLALQDYENMGSKPFIPLFIESFQAFSELKERCYVYARRENCSFVSQDLLYYSFGIYSNDGQLLARFNKLAVKQIRSKELLTKTGADTKKTLKKANTTEMVHIDEKLTAIQHDLQKMIAAMLGVSSSKISLDEGFYDQGLDSTQLLQMVRELEKKLNQQLYPTLLFEYPTIKELAKYLLEEYKESYPANEYHVETMESTETSLVYFKHKWEKMEHVFQNIQREFTGNLLLFAKNAQEYEAIKGLLSGRQYKVIWVKPGSSYLRLQSGIYEINPDNEEDYRRLIKEINIEYGLPTKILHIWAEKIDLYSQSCLEEQLLRGIYSIIFLGRMLMEQKLNEEVRLLYAYPYYRENLQPHHQAIDGFARTIQAENPKLIFRSLAFENVSNFITEDVLGILLNELDDLKAIHISPIRYLDGQRYIRELVKVEMETTNEESSLRNEGVYLITGGTGNLGMHFARSFASRGNVKLILAGRSNPNTEIEKKINELENLGSEAIYIKCDVSKRSEVQEMLNQIKTKFGNINGVLHCAGVIRDSLLYNKTKTDVEMVLGSKVLGTVLLDDILGEEKLDFFVLFSSTSALFGNPGQTDYAFANSFLDGFAEQRERLVAEGKRYGKTLSINWPLWKDGGMSINEDAKERALSIIGMEQMDTVNGFSVLGSGLKNHGYQLAVIQGIKEKIEGFLEKFKVVDTGEQHRKQIPIESLRENFEAKEWTQEILDGDIAIIGIGGRYPGANNLEEYWNNLKEGKDCISEIPPERWDYHDYYDPIPGKEGKAYSKWGGFIDDVDKFDSLFFNISPLEARRIDPQERLFIETVWKAVEDAGYTRKGLEDQKVGVFAGVMWLEYSKLFKGVPSGPAFSSIANRVSYIMNFKGPSMAVDTACSSSLEAVYLAYESILRGECELAVAGGINLLLHPNKYIYLCGSRFLSTDGRCRSFGAGGNGYVPGEGVGAVLLKPLKKAVSDGDNIYAVIKGVATNHGGRTSGYSVPNPVAHANLISEALKRSGIEPHSISYIETHGTGTSLGDPIEITGMAKAFSPYSLGKRHCHIGSVKSNIGHLESASGIAAMTKVILQMKNKMLVPSLHSETLNPNIDFDSTPFYVQQKLEEWITESPRRAGISSFGAGGSNVHVVMEEYIEKRDEYVTISVHNPALILFSTKTNEQLQEQVRQLLNFIKQKKIHDNLLADIAYTLQTGREAMDERLALTVSSVSELEEKLNGFLEGQKVQHLYYGQANQNIEFLDAFQQRDASQNIIDSWIEKRNYSKLLKLWAKGMEFDWNRLYEGAKPHRLSLPTYPFLREHCWESRGISDTKEILHSKYIHPLLHYNTSDFYEQRFSSTFSGTEFFLQDHVVAGCRVMPGVAYVEMAIAAVIQASGKNEEQKAIRIKDVFWLQPMTVDEEVEVHISLGLDETGDISFEVYSISNEQKSELQLHCCGKVDLSYEEEVPTYNIKALQEKFGYKTIESQTLYSLFEISGIKYGLGNKSIEKVYLGENQELAKLVLPTFLSKTLEQFTIHPSMADSALQATIVLLSKDIGSEQPMGMTPIPLALPYSMQEIRIFGKCTSNMWALVRYCSGSTADDKMPKFDIDLLDEQGKVCLQFKMLVSKALDGDNRSNLTRKLNMEDAAEFDKTEQPYVEHVLSEGKEELFRTKSTEYIKKIVSETLSIPNNRLDSSKPLEQYGVDSIIVMQLTNRFKQEFENVNSTLFFEHQTIDALTGYFMQNDRDILNKLVGLEYSEEEVEETVCARDVSYIPKLSTRKPRHMYGNHMKINTQGYNIQDVAVIGISGRYPKANNIQEFWENLKEGRNCITEIPEERWDWKKYYSDEKGKKGSIYTRWGGFIQDIDKFDPLFFQISPIEAEQMDPQERVFLEVTYECMENAGYTPANIGKSRKIGVFVGVMNGTYPTGSKYWSIANRISYVFNFQGPSVSLDTACSSSLTAIHMGLESLYGGTSECVIAGGVNLVVDPIHYMRLAEIRMVSPTNKCKSFGAEADGFVAGEGVGAVLLKPLQKAILDGDHIYGVIKGSMLNAGGKTYGYTVPNPEAQFHLISDALKRAKVNARSISYIEAHGTGTALGDPIEISGLTRAFEQDTKDRQFCAIGSSKSNIGHCESAAGIAAITKVLLQLQHGQLVPSLHSELINPNIDFSNTPFMVQQSLEAWERPTITVRGESKVYPRRAGISAFGAGGANAHVIIEEYIEEDNQRSCIPVNEKQPVIIILSAKTREQLIEKAKQLLKAILEQKWSDDDLADMAYTLQVGREAMEERLAVVTVSMRALEEQLRGFIEGLDIEQTYLGQVKQNKEFLTLFYTDEDLLKAVDTWILKRKYDKIADLWVKGMSIDWKQLYLGTKPRRMSLPTYPFTRERYWLPKARDMEKASFSLRRINSEKELNKVEEVREKDFGGDLLESKEELTSRPIMLAPVWQRVSIDYVEPFPKRSEKIVIIGEEKNSIEAIRQIYPNASVEKISIEDTIEDIQKKFDGIDQIDHILWLTPSNSQRIIADEGLIEDQNRCILPFFRVVKALLAIGYASKKLGWSVITRQAQPVFKNQWINVAQSGLHGFIGSMAKECPNWKIRLIDLQNTDDLPLEQLFKMPSDAKGDAWAYRQGEWYRQKLIEIPNINQNETLYKDKGVYVVIGGSGGIGESWSEYMIRTYDARIVWIGRRPQDEAILAKIDRLSCFGTPPVYIQADAADVNAMGKAYTKIKEHFNQIHGVVNSAIALLDQSLANMDEERFRAGLKAKVDVSVVIAKAFQGEPLDFVMFFSSVNSLMKGAGQSNYTAGCTFKDAFATQLSKEWSSKVKVVNWGYWGSLGVVASRVYQERMAQAGFGSIEPPEAMKALEMLLTGPVDQIVFLKITKLQAIEGMISDETLEIHEASHGSLIQKVQERMEEQNLSIPDLGDARRQGQDMDQVLVKLLWSQLQQMGLFLGKSVELKNISKKGGIKSLYARWMQETLTVLERNHYIKREGQKCLVLNSNRIDLSDVWKEWDLKKDTWLQNPMLKARVILTVETLRVLPDILTGRRLATEFMFPESSMKLVEGIYRNNPDSDYFNEVLAQTLITYIKERIDENPFVKLRIIEIGAGTGGTSAMVFSKIKDYIPAIQEYCYTDVSKAFLIHAEKEFGPQNPYLTYQLYNVEEPAYCQEVEVGEYDIVIATNVLHATQNIRQTIRNAKALLKKNGLILLNEITDNALFLHLTFGLLEGWWLYEDDNIRIPGCPGLYLEAWQMVLENEGFKGVFFPAKESLEHGQQIIVAESDGIVRQIKKLDSKGDCQKEVHIQKEVGYKTLKVPKASPKKEWIQPKFEVSQQMLREHVKASIIEKLSESLKVDIDKIDVDDSFADYGLDSITGIHMVKNINQALKLNLETSRLFDYSSVNQLTEYILSTYQDVIVKDLEQKKGDAGKLLGVRQLAQEKNDSHPSKHFIRKRAFTQMDYQRKETNQKGILQKEAIAVVGMSGRFAKSRNLDELWKHLENGTDLIEEVTRWDLSKVMPPEVKDYCNEGSFIDDIDAFDAFFFNISGLEASYMDPQQRIFLEESWRALEDAGYAGDGMNGRLCGVYVGCKDGGYSGLFNEDFPAQAMWGNSNSVLPSRISYYLNLQGPAVAIDTACSSSLVAIHMACQGLWTGEIEMALAGGIFIQCTPQYYIMANHAGMLSKTGRCHTFDQEANGFVPGEGVGVVVLKRLKDALNDGDHIYGVICGSGINQDGTTNGITAPSVTSQERLERYVYDSFNIDPENVQLVEAHGTGTKLGDPIEFEALTNAFKKSTEKIGYCALGSIKTNIGHAGHAAGVAGLIKALLSIKNKKIPPLLNFKTSNPAIPFEGSPFYVNTILKDWVEEAGTKRCAAVSSFGFGGTNAHMVVEEVISEERCHHEKPGYLIVLSARTMDQLKQQIQHLVEFCEASPNTDCGNMSYTLFVGRKYLSCRMACVIRNLNELCSLLTKWLEKGNAPQVYVSEANDNLHEQIALKQYGNQCIKNCQTMASSGEYLELLSAIAELYIQRYNLQYKELFNNDQYSRISLPSYPFARERFWIPKGNKLDKTESQTAHTERKTKFDEAFYNKLMDDILSNTIDVGDAVKKAENSCLNT